MTGTAPPHAQAKASLMHPTHPLPLPLPVLAPEGPAVASLPPTCPAHTRKTPALPPVDAARPPRLLLIEDDADIAALICPMLAGNGYAIERLADGRELDRVVRRDPPDLVILDLMLPGEDGLSICRRLRQRHAMPILMLTALGGEADRVIGLESGADDYLTKPFAPRELLARVRALLRRARWATDTPEEEPTCFLFEGWRLDMIRMVLSSPAGLQVPLTTAELGLLAAFCRRPQQVMSRESLLALVHQRAASVYDRSIDTLIGRLRRKIEDDVREPARIKTVRQGGYIFTPTVQAALRDAVK
jgi:two-component system OmpR family response regulator